MKFIKPYIFLRRSDDAGLITPRNQYYDSVYAPSVCHNNLVLFVSSTLIKIKKRTYILNKFSRFSH